MPKGSGGPSMVLKDEITALHLIDGQSTVIFGSTDGEIHLWNLDRLEHEALVSNRMNVDESDPGKPFPISSI